MTKQIVIKINLSSITYMHDSKFPHQPPLSLYTKWKALKCSKFKRASVAGEAIALGSPDVTTDTLQVDFNDDVEFQFAKFSNNFLVYSEKPWTPPPSLNPRQPRIKTC